MVASVVGGLISAVGVCEPANAGTTAASTLTETGYDLTNPSTATVGTPGNAYPGDTLKWVLNYENTTGAEAASAVTDPVTGNQAYVPGSLQVPPTAKPEWSTNNGATYSDSEPTSGVDAIGVQLGTDVPGSTGVHATLGVPATIAAGSSSGDGFNLVSYDGDVYNVFHASYPSHGGRDAEIDCHVLATGARCPGVFIAGSYGGAFVPAAAGAALIPGLLGTTTADFKIDEPLWTSSSNFTVIDQTNGHLYYAATYAPGGTPTGAFGTACVDLNTLTSCGFTQLGTTDPEGAAITRSLASGGAVTGDEFWILDYAGNLDCLDMATNTPCATASVDAFPSYVPTLSAAEGNETSSSPVYTFDGRYLFAKLTTDTGGNPQNQYLSCVDTSTDALCPGWSVWNDFSGTPTVISEAYPTGASSLQNAVDLPVTDPSGDLVGACTEAATGYGSGAPLNCVALDGSAMSDPYPVPGSNPAPPPGNIGEQSLGSPDLVGTRVYVPYYDSTYVAGTATTTTYACFDFSDEVAGIAQPCAGYSPLVSTGLYDNAATNDVRPYALGPVAGVPDCLGEDGDGGLIQFISTVTGVAGCSSSTAIVSVDPPSYYCGGTSHATAWSQIVLGGISGAQYAKSQVTVTDENNNPISGWTDRLFPANQQTVDISSIPYGGTTVLLHVTVDLLDEAQGISPTPSFEVTFSGDPAQLCFETTVPDTCEPATTVTNDAAAVTTGINGVTDAPAGNGSGAVTFDEAAPASPYCTLSIKKTVTDNATGVAVTTAHPGEMLKYTIVISNTGTAAFSSTFTGSYVDDLTNVLTEAAYQNDVAVTPAGSGTVSYASPKISWTSGTLASGAISTVTYEAKVNAGAAGTLTNSVAPGATPPPASSNCPGVSCTVDLPIDSFTLAKSVAPTGSQLPGTVLTYTVKVVNSSAGAGAVNFSDPLTGVLTDAVYNYGSATTAVSAGTNGAFSSEPTAGNPIAALTWADASLSAGATATITYKVTIYTPDDSAGATHLITNTITSTTAGTDCDSGSADPRCTTSTPVGYVLQLTKTASVSQAVVGQTVTYTVSATNTTAVALSGQFSDSLAAVIPAYASYVAGSAEVSSGPGAVSYTAPGAGIVWSGTLGASGTTGATGATATITYQVLVTGVGPAGHSLENTVVSTTPGSNCPSGVPNSHCSTSTPVHGLTFTKTASEQVADPGDVLTYTVVAHNDGAAYTTAVPASFTDSLANLAEDASYVQGSATASEGTVSYASSTGIAWSDPLAVGAVATVTYEVRVNTYDTGPHLLDNAVISTSPGSNCASGSGAAACSTSTPVADIALVKSATPSVFTAAGDTITYSYTVTNAGQVPLAAISVDDSSLPGLSPVNCGGATTLGVGASTSCTATYVTTAADLTTGSVTNVANATGTGAGASGPVTSPYAAVTVFLGGLNVTKAVSRTSFTGVGETLTYTIVVSNTAYATLTDVTLNDSLAGSGLYDVVCGIAPLPIASLEPFGSTTCSALYKTTASDVSNKEVTNTVSASAGPVTSNTATAQSSYSALTITKTASPTSFTGSGQTVTYTMVLDDTGATTISSITVSDPLAGLSAISCGGSPLPVASLAAGTAVTCTATYQTTTADVTSGGVTNTASATGTDPDGTTVDSNTASVTVTDSQLTITKTASPATFSAPGTTITFNLAVEDAGATTISNITVSDPLPGLSAVDCPGNLPTIASLGVGQTIDCTATYATTQTDVDSGLVTNTATAAGTDSQGNPIASNQATVGVTAVQSPGVSMTESVAEGTFTGRAQSLHYSFDVTNTGNVTLTGVVVDDTLVGLTSPACLTTTLSPAQSTTCTATYQTTSADVTAGSVTDTASATGTESAGTTVGSNTTSATVPYSQLSLTKTATTPSFTAARQVLDYSYKVTNTGTTTLTGLSITDNKVLTSNISCPVTTLAPGVSTTCVTTTGYTTTRADVNAGSVTNVATAKATAPNNSPVTSATSTVTVLCTRSSSLTLRKSSTASHFSTAGQVLAYRYLVTNTGNTTLQHIAIHDDKIPSSKIRCPRRSLLPGASLTCTADYTVTQSDINAGAVTNVATATATGPSGHVPVSQPSAVTVSALVPGLLITKSVNATTAAPGETVTYTVRLTDTGQLAYGTAGVPDANFTDSLGGILSDGNYLQGTLEASSGTSTYSARRGIAWSGPLAVGATTTVSYKIKLKLPDTGAHELVNTVESTSVGSTCQPGAGGAGCSTSTPIADISLLEQVCTSSSPADCGPKGAGPWSSSTLIGFRGTVYWKITVANNGRVPLRKIALSDPGFALCARRVGVFNLPTGADLVVYCAQGDVAKSRVNVATIKLPAPLGAPPGSPRSVGRSAHAAVMVMKRSGPSPIGPPAPPVTG
jgi:uncharacterized repeat protein (TIGR01451 family)